MSLQPALQILEHRNVGATVFPERKLHRMAMARAALRIVHWKKQDPVAWISGPCGDKGKQALRAAALSHGVCHDGPTSAQWPWPIHRRIVRGLMLDLRIELRAEQNHDR